MCICRGFVQEKLSAALIQQLAAQESLERERRKQQQMERDENEIKSMLRTREMAGKRLHSMAGSVYRAMLMNSLTLSLSYTQARRYP